MGIQTDAGSAAARFRARSKGFLGAVHQALQRVAIAVNRKQIENMSGSGQAEAGSYPIPVRSGNARRSDDWGFLDSMTSYVIAGGPSAPYVFQLFEGLGTSGRHGRRDAQGDAVRDTDSVAIISTTLDSLLA